MISINLRCQPHSRNRKSNKTFRHKNAKYIPRHGNKKLKQIISSNNQSKVLQKRQLYVLKELNIKLTTDNAIVTQANKGKTIVIINSNEYSEEINSFLLANKFNTLRTPLINSKNPYIRQCR